MSHTHTHTHKPMPSSKAEARKRTQRRLADQRRLDADLARRYADRSDVPEPERGRYAP